MIASMPRARRAGAAALAALALALVTGCTNADDQPQDAATPGQEPSVATAPASPASPSDSPSADTSAPPSATGTTTATPATALLDWKTLPGNPSATISTNGTWTLTITPSGRSWSLANKGGGSGSGRSVPQGQRVMKAGLDDDYAVVVYGTQSGRTPQTAVVTTLASGEQATIDGSSDLPPASDGSWSLDGSTLWHATGGDGSSPYCLVSTDLTTMTSTRGWCAGEHDGFTNILSSGGRVAMMTFDDARPTSCRTLVTVDGTRTTPVPGVPACKGIQAAVLHDGSTVWSMVPNEHRYQQVEVYGLASSGATVDLGAGVNGTMTVCGDAAYWAKDATGSTAPAVMRWDGSTLTTAFEGKGFLGQPLCAGHVLSIVESGDSGDRQLSATVS